MKKEFLGKLRNKAKNSGLVILLLLASRPATATVLWAGGEDLDFPNGSTVCTDATAGKFRANYARHAIYPCTASTMIKSTPFQGGAVTSLWFSVQLYISTTCSVGIRYVGLGKIGTNNSLFLGSPSAGASSKVTLWKYDGTTWTELANEAGASMVNGKLHRFDVQIINYGAAGTVNVYLSGSGLPVGSGTPIISYTGDLRAGGNTDLNSVFAYNHNICGTTGMVSEMIVSDFDTRSMSLVTLAPNAAGDNNQWSNGTYTTVNTNTANDASPITDNTNGDLFQANLIDLPAGTSLTPIAVKISARGSTSPGGMTALSVGVKTNNTIHAPAAVTQLGGWTNTETYYSTNPVTAVPWTSSDINNLQINLQPAP